LAEQFCRNGIEGPGIGNAATALPGSLAPHSEEGPGLQVAGDGCGGLGTCPFDLQGQQALVGLLPQSSSSRQPDGSGIEPFRQVGVLGIDPSVLLHSLGLPGNCGLEPIRMRTAGLDDHFGHPKGLLGIGKARGGGNVARHNPEHAFPVLDHRLGVLQDLVGLGKNRGLAGSLGWRRRGRGSRMGSPDIGRGRSPLRRKRWLRRQTFAKAFRRVATPTRLVHRIVVVEPAVAGPHRTGAPTLRCRVPLGFPWRRDSSAPRSHGTAAEGQEEGRELRGAAHHLRR
jgi:hypothetical protein